MQEEDIGSDGNGLDDVREVVTVVESLTRGEIEAQVRTAHAFPRSIKVFINEAMQMATLDEDTAASCIYALPRAGKSIEGPSVRLAEIVASAWGNCRAGARVISEDDRFVVAGGYFFDVQRNTAVAFEVRRRITDKSGRRYNDDMISQTSNAACSIALRNAVLKGVPKAFWGKIYDAAKHTAIGDAKTLETKRAELISYFGKMGVTPDRVLSAVGKKAIEDVGLDELAVLRGTATAIKDGDTTIEEAFAHAPIAMPQAVPTAAAKPVQAEVAQPKPEKPKQAAPPPAAPAVAKAAQPPPAAVVQAAAGAAPASPVAEAVTQAVGAGTSASVAAMQAQAPIATPPEPAKVAPTAAPAATQASPAATVTTQSSIEWKAEYANDPTLVLGMKLTGRAIKTAGATVVTFAKLLAAVRKFDAKLGAGQWHGAATLCLGRELVSVYHVSEQDAQKLTPYLTAAAEA